MARIAAAPAAVLPDVSMSQSSLLASALLGGFIIWLAMNGKLATYWALLTGGSAQTAAQAAATSVNQQGVTTPTSTATSTAVVGQPGSPSVTPTAQTLWNLLTGNWWQPAQSTSQGTQTPAGSAASASAGAGIGMM